MQDVAADGPVTVTVNNKTLSNTTFDSCNITILDFSLLSVLLKGGEVSISINAKHKPTTQVTNENLDDRYPCRSTSNDLFSIQLMARDPMVVMSNTVFVRPNKVVLLR